MRHIGLLWLGVSHRAALSRQGFWLSNPDNMAPTESVAAVGELLCEEAGAWCLALLYRRLQRLLPLVIGWPSGAIHFLGEAETAAAEMQEFRRDHDNFLRLQQALPRFEHLRELHARTLFQRQCVL